jgi:hypothetical protein
MKQTAQQQMLSALLSVCTIFGEIYAAKVTFLKAYCFSLDCAIAKY